MRVFYLFIYLFLITPLFAFQTLELSPDINTKIINKPSYLLGEFTQDEAYNKFKNKEFIPLTKELKSFGFSNDSLWICFEAINNSDKELFLSLVDSSIDKVTLYKYQNNKLLKIEQDGLFIPKSNKNLENFVPKFYLEKSNNPIVYLLKINSSVPLSIEMLIGSNSDIINSQLPEIVILFIFIGSFISLFIYNSFLYLSTKEYDYVLYAGYILFLLVWIISFHGYFTLIFQSGLEISNIIKYLSFVGISLFLILFTFKFLNIKQSYPKILFLLLVLSFLTLLFIINEGALGQYINIISTIIITVVCLYLGISSHIRGYKPAKYFSIGLIGYLLGTLITFLMFEGFYSSNFCILEAQLIGSIWTMIFLSLGLGDKIRLLHNERNEAILKTQVQEKILFLQSRQVSVAELIGNIAHQWREPLSEIGAIQTNLEATLLLKGAVSKEKLLSTIEQNHNILHHLSNTIDIFYRFFKHKKSDEEEFNIIEEIHNIKKMVYYSLNVENISLEFEYEDYEAITYGNKSEFINALLNIILNAKDIIVERKIINPYILIKINKSSDFLIIKIEDNAGGIRQEPIEKIFDSCISDKEDNLGIGLFITKKIIEQRMGGKISVENTEIGAVFTILIPHIFSLSKIDDSIGFFDFEESTFLRIARLERKVSKQIEVENALKQWEEIFRQTHWGVAVHQGTSNKFEMINPAFCLMYGYSEKELEKLSFIELFSSESLYILEKKQKEAFEKSFSSFEAIHVRKDGSKFPVNIDLTIVKNENGDILYHIANVRDITKQKESNQKLLLKKFALDHVHEAIYLIDEKGSLKYVNKGACLILGYTESELLKLNIGDIDADWPIERWPNHWEVIKKIKTMTMELRHKRKDGTIFPVEVMANYFEYDGIGYNMGLARDITERKAAQEDLLLKEFSLNKINEAVYLIDENAKFHYVNENACDSLGYTKEEMMTMSVFDIDPDISLEWWKEHWNKMPEVKTSLILTQHIKKDGSICPIEVNANYVEYNGIEYHLAVSRNITERLLAEAEKENRIIRTITENSPDIIVRFDAQGRRIYLNPKAQELFNYDKSLLGKTLADITPVINKDIFEMNLQTVIQKGIEISFETAYITASSENGWAHIRMVPEFDSEGNVVSVLSLGRDITERKEMEEALKQSGQLLQTVIDATPDWIFIKDKEHRYQLVNKGYADALHIAPEDFIGKNDLELGFPEELVKGNPNKGIRGFWADDNLVLTTNKEQVFSNDPATIDGVIHTFHTIKVPMRDANGKPWGILAFARDITELKELETLLEKEHKFLIDAQRVAHTGSWYLDIENDTLFWSDETYRIFELDKENIDDLHQTFYECVHPDDREMVSVPYLESLKTGIPYEIEHRIVMKDGRIKYVIERCEHAYDGEGNPLYSIGTVQDITERKITQNKIEILNATLEQRVEERTKELAKKEREYRTLSENLPDFLARYDKKYRRIYVNNAVAEYFGMSTEELRGTTLEDKPLNGVPKGYKEKIEYVFQTGKTTDIELNHEKDGKKRWWNIIFTPEFDENADVINVLTIGHDITQEKKTLLALQKSEEAFRAIVENSPDVIIRFDLEGNRTYINPIGLKLMNKEYDDIVDKNIDAYSPLLQLEKFKEVFANAVKDKEEKIYEGVYMLPDGSQGWGEQRIVPEFDSKGKVISVLLIGRDFSELKKLQDEQKELRLSLEQKVQERTKELQKALAFNESIINALPDMLFEVSKDGVYLNIWARDEKLLAEQKEMLLGKNFRDILPPDAVEVSIKTMNEVYQYGSSMGNIYKLDLPDGKHWFELSAVKKEPEGSYLALSRDITERKNAQMKIEE